MTQTDDTLRAVLSEKCHELFVAYGVACAEAETASTACDPDFCVVLGFTGEQLRGAVSIVASAAAIADSNPVGNGPTSGWAAELVNQLGGRLKNTLLRRRVEIALSIPFVLTGTALAPLPSCGLAPIALRVGSGPMTAWLEVEYEPDLVVPLVDEADTDVANEGDSMMFF